MSFENLNLIEPIMKALKEEGYETPTPIQSEAIPVIDAGQDLLGCAQTGTGKTAAFAIPILQRLYRDKDSRKGQRVVRVLVLTPTRELAVQIDESFAAYGRHTGLRHAVVFGGVSQRPQVSALRAGIDILTATPGRLLDLMGQGFVNLQNIDVFVLDEADRMLDMGFIVDVKRIIAKLPAKRQTLFFSATMPSEITGLANSILHNPVKVAVTPVSSTVDLIDQAVFFVDRQNKRNLLTYLLKEPGIKSALIFTRTKHGADKVSRDLERSGIKAESIHGNKSQGARQRALSNFKTGHTRVLVATDIAARGIDVDDLSHVINYEMPDVPETYVHRIGRTGRAGNAGIAFSFIDNEERGMLRDVENLTGKLIALDENHPWHTEHSGPIPVTSPSRGGGRKPSSFHHRSGRRR